MFIKLTEKIFVMLFFKNWNKKQKWQRVGFLLLKWVISYRLNKFLSVSIVKIMLEVSFVMTTI